LKHRVFVTEICAALLQEIGRRMGARLWIWIVIGSTLGGFVPALWGDSMLSVSAILLSGVGAVVGLWFGWKLSH
jgi:hypothetical protein